MSDALNAIGNFFTKDVGSLFSKANLGTTLPAINLGAGEIGNLLAGRQSQQLYNQLNAPLKKFESLTPAQLTAQVRSAEAPINQGLLQDVGNQVQADMASRGLAQAPGLFAAAESQALGPIMQQNYQTALEQVLQQYNIPAQYAYVLGQYLPKGQNMTPAMQLLLQQLSKRFGNNFPTMPGPGTTGQFPTTPTPVTGGLIPPGSTPPDIPWTPPPIDFSAFTPPTDSFAGVG